MFSRIAQCPVCNRDVHKALLAAHVEVCLEKVNGDASWRTTPTHAARADAANDEDDNVGEGPRHDTAAPPTASTPTTGAVKLRPSVAPAGWHGFVAATHVTSAGTPSLSTATPHQQVMRHPLPRTPFEDLANSTSASARSSGSSGANVNGAQTTAGHAPGYHAGSLIGWKKGNGGPTGPGTGGFGGGGGVGFGGSGVRAGGAPSSSSSWKQQQRQQRHQGHGVSHQSKSKGGLREISNFFIPAVKRDKEMDEAAEVENVHGVAMSSKRTRIDEGDDEEEPFWKEDVGDGGDKDSEATKREGEKVATEGEEADTEPISKETVEALGDGGMLPFPVRVMSGSHEDCGICLQAFSEADGVYRHVFYPCQHVRQCGDCAIRIWQIPKAKRRCPWCKSKIEVRPRPFKPFL